MLLQNYLRNYLTIDLSLWPAGSNWYHLLEVREQHLSLSLSLRHIVFVFVLVLVLVLVLYLSLYFHWLDLLMWPFGSIGAACSGGGGGSWRRNTRRSEGLGDLLILEISSFFIYHLSAHNMSLILDIGQSVGYSYMLKSDDALISVQFDDSGLRGVYLNILLNTFLNIHQGCLLPLKFPFSRQHTLSYRFSS